MVQGWNRRIAYIQFTREVGIIISIAQNISQQNIVDLMVRSDQELTVFAELYFKLKKSNSKSYLVIWSLQFYFELIDSTGLSSP